jgi:ATP-dependent DNA helicase RecQ
MKQPLDILKQYWGHAAFREMQADIVDSVLQGNDTLALLPTGGGKSICFQVPALCQDGICIVVSPLIALMKDQVLNLTKRGISAYAIYSGMNLKDIDRIFDNCVNGDVKFLYLSPERLGSEMAQERIKRMKVNLIAVDEAHCISQWGYDFRPSYLINIGKVRELHPKVPVMALTATATKEVVEDIQEKLGFLPNKKVFKKSFARNNLAYLVLQEEDKRTKLLDILKKVQGSAVVYVLNRKETKDTATFLMQNNISAGYYHAGLDAEWRSGIQDAWIKNELRVIVATNAFGMGIDKPDVRVVVHLTLPESLEAYFQEAGRGGRDGEKAFGVLLYNQSDRERLERNFESSFPSFQEVRQVYRALGSYYQLAIGAGAGQSFPFDVLEFSTKYELNPLRVLPSLKLLAQAQYVEMSESVYFPSTMQILMDNKTLYDYYLRQPKSEKMIKFMLRSYQGAFNHDVNIKEKQIAAGLKLPLKEVEAMLQKLHQERVIRYKPMSDNPMVTFIVERQDADHLLLDKAHYDFLKVRAEARMKASLHYAEERICRSQMLLAYFDEKDAPACGQCDVCLGRYNAPTEEERQKIIAYIRSLLQKSPMPLRKVVSSFPSSMENKVLQVMQHLIDNAYIRKNNEQLLVWNQ